MIWGFQSLENMICTHVSDHEKFENIHQKLYGLEKYNLIMVCLRVLLNRHLMNGFGIHYNMMSLLIRVCFWKCLIMRV